MSTSDELKLLRNYWKAQCERSKSWNDYDVHNPLDRERHFAYASICTRNCINAEKELNKFYTEHPTILGCIGCGGLTKKNRQRCSVCYRKHKQHNWRLNAMQKNIEVMTEILKRNSQKP